LVKGVDGQFEKLASSILAVGVNSVSTESEVIAIASQLASIANIAGFSADELIGFSSALASVGTRPELARGTFTRLFSEINRSVSGTTENLGRFARLAGQSVDEFREAWTSGRGTDVIIELLRGLSTQGAEAELSLRALGITSVRDIPTLLKLAQSIDEVEKELLTAKVAFIAGTELNEQYGIISETLSERLVVLKNNFQALIATIGNLTGPLKVLVNALITLIGFIEFLARNPITQFFLAFAVAIAGVVGVATLLGGALARVAAGAAGLLTTMIEVRTAIGVTQLGIAGLNTSLSGTTVAANGATAAMAGFAAANVGVAGAASAAAGATGIAGVNSAIRSFMGVSKPATGAAVGLGSALFGLFKQSKGFPLIALAGKFAFWGSVIFLVVGAINALGKSFGF
jgi:TP901 family phage tail tape measure protein